MTKFRQIWSHCFPPRWYITLMLPIRRRMLWRDFLSLPCPENRMMVAGKSVQWSPARIWPLCSARRWKGLDWTSLRTPIRIWSCGQCYKTLILPPQRWVFSVRSFRIYLRPHLQLVIPDALKVFLSRQRFNSGREPWSSGYGKRLAFWRSWVQIPAPYTGWTFFHMYLL